MEANSYQFRPNTWKYSIVKQSTVQSRILADNKDVPTKFSPAKYLDSSVSNTSKSLVRSKILSKSHDEISLKDLKDITAKKEKEQQRIKEIMQTPRQMNQSINLKAVESEGSFTLKFDSPMRKDQLMRKNSSKSQNFEFIKDIKVEYLRFKERILNQLKKQEESIQKVIQQIMLMITTANPGNNIRSSVYSKTVTALPSQIPAFISPISSSTNILPRVILPSLMTVDTVKYRESLVTSQVQIQSVIPKIKQKVDKMFNLMGQLKKEINQQSENPLLFERAQR